MDGKSPLISMVFQWILVQKPLLAMVFQWFWSPKPLVAMVFQWFWVQKPLVAMVFQWFPMVANHWSDDGMVTIHRSGLVSGQGGKMKQTGAILSLGVLLVEVGNTLSIFALQCTETPNKFLTLST